MSSLAAPRSGAGGQRRPMRAGDRGGPAQARPQGRPAQAGAVLAALVLGGMVFGFAAGALGSGAGPLYVLGLTAVLLPVAIWRRPQLGPAVLMTAAVLVQQVGQDVSPTDVNNPGAGAVVLTPSLPITSHIPLFAGIGSLHVEGADVLLAVIAIVYLLRTSPATRNWPRSHVSNAMVAVLGTVGLGIVLGVAHHGKLRVSLMEARPYVYLASAYVLTAALIRTRSALRGVLWAFVVAAGLKAVQGMVVFWQVRNFKPRPEAVLGHEDAYIFGIFILLVAVLWLFEVRGSLRSAATWLLPLVIAGDLVNNRRAAWMLLGGGLLVLGAIGYRWLPERRRALGRVAAVLLVLSAVYIPAYWNKTGSLAEPARAVRSMISPDPRDASSDLYRLQEDANLKYNIHLGGVLGRGFGVPIDYALPIVNISSIDPNIAYVPHNGVLYILMRMGVLGAVAFWSLLATAIVAGCRLARLRDRELAAVGALLASALVAYALEGAIDQGFSFYRIAFVTGILLGLAEAARRISRRAPSLPA